MAAVSFDTLRFANAHKNAELPSKQAEAVATALAEAFQVNFKDIATKDDLKALEVAVKADLKALELTAKADIGKVTGKLDVLAIQINHLKWVLGLGMSAMFVMVSAILRILLVR